MSANVIYLAEVLDPEAYEVYKKNVEPNILAVGGTYVVRGGEVDFLEGTLPAPRAVILGFTSPDPALACYHLEDYAAIKKKRVAVAQYRTKPVLVRGRPHARRLVRQ